MNDTQENIILTKKKLHQVSNFFELAESIHIKIDNWFRIQDDQP